MAPIRTISGVALDILTTVAASAMAVIVVPLLQPWAFLGWLFIENAFHIQMWSVAETACWWTTFAVVGIAVTLFLPRNLQNTGTALALVPILAAGAAWASPDGMFALASPDRVRTMGYVILGSGFTVWIYRRSKARRDAAESTNGNLNPPSSPFTRQIASRSALALMNLGGVVAGYSAIKHFKLAEYPPFARGFYEIAGYISFPPPTAWVLFADSTLGRLLIWWLAILTFALIDPRWLRPKAAATRIAPAGPLVRHLRT